MKRTVLIHLGLPLVGLGCLLAGACLASIWYINRLEAELSAAVRRDATSLLAASELQIQLRHLRFHSMVAMADPSEFNREEVATDRRRFDAAYDALRKIAGPDDLADLREIDRRYRSYLAELEYEVTARPAFGTIGDLVRWSDAHKIKELLGPCRELTDRAQARMADSIARGEAQALWAERTLLVVGLFGPLAGLTSGAVVARAQARRVAQISVRIQAVRAHLDQDVGAMTLAAPTHFGELDAQLERVVGRVKDVCARLQATEREVLRAEQLSAVGQLAAGVAHEVRNPLTGIKMLVDAALRPSAPTPLEREDLQLIRAEIERMERTAQQLLDYAKPSRPNRKPHDLRGLVARVLDANRPRAANRAITVSADLPPDPLVTAVDPDQFTSVVSNLLLNALDATPANGRITVRAARHGDGEVRVTVSDSGRGIPPEVVDRLFTPFATTKPTGTGLGLIVSRRVAHDHGGTLTAANRPGGGAEFTVTLPAAEAGHAEAAGR